MDLTPAEKAAGRAFRDIRYQALSLVNETDPPDIRVQSVWHHIRHNCPAHAGKSFSLELRERYVKSPETEVHLDGGEPAGVAFVDTGEGGKFDPLLPEGFTSVVIPAGRFGFIWKEGKCGACGATVRSTDGRFVIAAERPPERSARG